MDLLLPALAGFTVGVLAMVVLIWRAGPTGDEAELERAKIDAIVTGYGFLRRTSEGKIERVDPREVKVSP